jgi:hypothetical protein
VGVGFGIGSAWRGLEDEVMRFATFDRAEERESRLMLGMGAIATGEFARGNGLSARVVRSRSDGENCDGMLKMLLRKTKTRQRPCLSRGPVRAQRPVGAEQPAFRERK